jgi:hypothetical protein
MWGDSPLGAVGLRVAVPIGLKARMLGHSAGCKPVRGRFDSFSCHDNMWYNPRQVTTKPKRHEGENHGPEDHG